MNKPADIEALLAKIRQEYAESTADRLEQFDFLIDKLYKNDPNADEYRLELRRDVHSMKGSAGSCGFPGISAIAHRLEDYLETCGQLDTAALRDVETYVETIRDISQTSVEPEGDALTELLNSLPSASKSAKVTDAFSDQTQREINVHLVMPRGLQRKVVSKELVSCGFHVSLSDRGIDALSAMLTNPSDLVLTAMELPDMSGTELSAALAVLKKTEKAKVALLTSYDLDSPKLGNLPKDVPIVHKDEAFIENLATCLTELGLLG